MSDDVKEKKENPDHINLKVVGQDGNEVYFKIKRTTQFRKLMDAYCERSGKSSDTVRFLYDGNRLNQNQTPDDLDMEDEDTIDVMVEQVGGL